MSDTRTGSQRIADERARQIAKEGWTPEHDDEHAEGELALVGALYATPVKLYERTDWGDFSGRVTFEDPWPGSWDREWDKRLKERSGKTTNDERIRELEKAGALIAAEIDRLLRKRAATWPSMTMIGQAPASARQAGACPIMVKLRKGKECASCK